MGWAVAEVEIDTKAELRSTRFMSELNEPPESDTVGKSQRFEAAATGYENWKPHDARRLRAWLRLSGAAKRKRFAQGLRRLEAIRLMAARSSCESERKGSARLVKWASRSSVRRWQRDFRRDGFEGLIQWNIAPESPMPDEIRTAICTMVRMDRDVSVEAIVEHVTKFHQFKASETTVNHYRLKPVACRCCWKQTVPALAG